MDGGGSMTDFDVIVIGGGPAGLAASVELRKLGSSKVLIIEREKALGGIPRHCHHTGFGWFDLGRILSGPAYAKKRAMLAERAGVSLLTETTALNFPNEQTIRTTGPSGIREISARAFLLATGCRERPRSARLVAGSRPAGVFTTGSLQQTVYFNRQKAGTRAVIIGAEHVSFSALHTLVTTGTEVSALVTEYPKHQTYSAFRFLTASRYRVPIFCNSRIVQIHGHSRVESVEIEDIGSGKFQKIPCDTVVFTGDWIPDHDVARRAGLMLDEGTRGPSIDERFQTSRRGFFAAGNLLRGAEMADTVALEGKRAARSIYQFLCGEESYPTIVLKRDLNVLWISPNRLSLRNKRFISPFVFRTRKLFRQGRLEVFCGKQWIYQEFYRRLIPNRSYRCSGSWARGLETTENVSILLRGEIL